MLLKDRSNETSNLSSLRSTAEPSKDGRQYSLPPPGRIQLHNNHSRDTSHESGASLKRFIPPSVENNPKKLQNLLREITNRENDETWQKLEKLANVGHKEYSQPE